MFNTGIEKALNMGSVIEGEYTVETGLVTSFTGDSYPIPVEIKDNKLEDSSYIRDTLRALIDSTKDALDVALTVQEEDPSSRNTEAVSKMADSVSKCLATLITLNKTEKDEEFRNREETPKVVNNNLIVMSTQELISTIMNQTKQLKRK
jgi:hypothetical protein